LWRSPSFAPSEEGAGDGEIVVLGRRVPYPPENWSLPGHERLRRFHLHYGDEVLGWVRKGDIAAAGSALQAWIAGNPPRRGDAWHPYPLSTRVSNWIAAATLAPELATPAVVESLSRQFAFLVRNVENDVLGNHVIRNAKALILGGITLDDPELLRAGRELLSRELPEQVLPDGGHYERSPSYHRLVLRDLLEVQPYVPVEHEVDLMMRFASASSRPDGAPALFNDGGLDIAPPLDLAVPLDGSSVFPETGYVFVRAGDAWIAVDCGAPAPPFLPSHAHADALSVQVWARGEPVVVDPGTSTYEPGSTRTRERSTRAHSTVSIDGGDQFESWGSFRSGPYPDVRLIASDARSVEAEARWRTGATHRRVVTWGDDEITVSDAVVGAKAVCESRMTLAPGLPGGTGAITSGTDTTVEEASSSERFGAIVATSNLVQRRAGASVGFEWRIRARAP
jgi:uncharacterized heparinase superfamily protein